MVFFCLLTVLQVNIYAHSHKVRFVYYISATLMKKAGIYLEMHAASTYGLVEQEKRFAHRMYPVLPPQSLKMLSQAELTKMLWFP